MNLQKKGDNNFKKPTFSPTSVKKPVKKAHVPDDKYEILYESLLPHGKYKNKTYQWVIDNDDWYQSWMEDNNILEEWGIKVLKEKPVDKVIANYEQYFKDFQGYYWICLIEKPGNGIPSPFL